MLDSSLDYIQSLRNDPVWRSISVSIRTILGQDPLPEHTPSLSDIYCNIITNNGPKLGVYKSTETHGCVIKALELGSKATYLVAIGEDVSIRIDELRIAIQDDREKCLVSFCILENSGIFE
jgi:hypothetical protein